MEKNADLLYKYKDGSFRFVTTSSLNPGDSLTFKEFNWNTVSGTVKEISEARPAMGHWPDIRPNSYRLTLV